MKQRKSSLAAIVFVLGALLLNACNLAAQGLPAPTASQAPIPAADTQVPPTLVPPSATPTLNPINSDTVAMLEYVGRFELGDVVRSLAFTADGRVLAAAGGNDRAVPIQLWDMASGETLGALNGHTGIVWDVAFSPDGQMLASVSSDLTAKVWDWSNATVIKSLDFPGQVVSVSFSPNGQSLAVGGVDTPQNQVLNAAVWTFSVGSWAPQLKLPEFWNISAMAYSPSGDALLGGGTSRNLQVWRTKDGTRVFTLSHAHQATKAAISPDGSTVATATCQAAVGFECTQGGVWLWNLPTGKLIQQLGGFPLVVQSLAFTADGSALIVASRDGTLRIYATSDYSTLFDYVYPGGIDALAVSANGRLLATGGSDGVVRLWVIVDRR